MSDSFHGNLHEALSLVIASYENFYENIVLISFPLSAISGRGKEFVLHSFLYQKLLHHFLVKSSLFKMCYFKKY